MSVNQRAKNQARIQSAREIVRSSKNVPCVDCGVRIRTFERANATQEVA